MRLAAIVEDAEHVCSRYRLAAFRDLFAQAGHCLELVPWPRHWWSQLQLGQELRDSAILVQRRLLSRWQLYLLRRAACLLLFDFDDAVFLRDSYSPKGLHSSRRLRRFAAQVRASDVIIAGNAFLAQEAARWSGHARVHVIPTCVDARRYSLAEHHRSGAGVKLVWIGSASTLLGLQAVAPLLDNLGQRYPWLRLKLICDQSLPLKHLPVVACPWSEGSEAADIASADIGISWVPDDLWSRGKCGLKVLQYMAAGLPVVANPVGIHTEMVWHGETGFLAETPEQWIDAVGRLAHDPALRRHLGQAGRRLVEKHYSIEAGGARWIGLLQNLRHEREAA